MKMIHVFYVEFDFRNENVMSMSLSQDQAIELVSIHKRETFIIRNTLNELWTIDGIKSLKVEFRQNQHAKIVLETFPK